MDKFKLFFEEDFENIDTELDEFKQDLSVGIIGAGKLGLALVSAFNKTGKLRWVLTRSNESKLEVINKIYNSQIVKSEISELNFVPKFIFICVGDQQIEEVALSLADKFGLELEGKYIIHCSGFLNVSILESCHILGAKTASTHPFQTFYYDSESVFKNISWGVESTDEDFSTIANLVKTINGNPIRLPEEAIANKKLYHAVAVAASNYLTPVLQFANEIAKSMHLEADDLIYSIAKTTLTNNVKSFAKGDFPLTGPIARGDIETIKMHLNAMQGKPEMIRPYSQLGIITAEMAFNKGLLSEDSFFDILQILKEGQNC